MKRLDITRLITAVPEDKVDNKVICISDPAQVKGKKKDSDTKIKTDKKK